ncbi:Mut7-C RNAse domain-containing protein [Amphritea balenae]|uniref:Twitching motility protein PilT n=1 Tax=Amphritea balenae TaxID=452629 RepID=A0A3P1SWA8_9GAMM|nr:Mut7-C RNAse domain-containing protein [Amphritea balenae]RRD01461.1 twitching motility protein PilT [Amphritea balenae]GGK56945.1 hypothetical protein GCM10007941_03830 [Amphritea balenae]
MNNDPHAPVTHTASFRFYEELNDFLPRDKRKLTFDWSFIGWPTVKDCIEAIGVPHCEIDLILVNGASVEFNYPMQGGERVAVYPQFEAFDITPLIRLRPKPLRETKFVVDVNLGTLARKLRLLGFDTLYRNDFGDNELVDISVAERRIILTRDLGVLKHGAVSHGYWVRSDDPRQQVRELVERLQLQKQCQPFIRCSHCNGILQEVDKGAIVSRIPEDTLKYSNKYWQCPDCKRVYWRGSHYSRVQEWINDLIG